MRRGSRSSLVLAVLTALAVGVPAQAATVGITIADFSFSPQIAHVGMGSTAQWTNNGPSTHTTTQDAPLALWDSGSLAVTTSFGQLMQFAGVFPYHCAIHSSMTGKIRTPIGLSPRSGTTATTFTIRVATIKAPSGFVYDVQERVGSGPWASYMMGVTTKTLTFQATAPGSYAFRSRLRRVSDGATSGYSPPKTATVS